ncbi:UNVERIFIED_CONTAM: hypothetical protein GTU68_011018 [Idotea baltica]|nr:hypothetical protein [Idotea baltica]
MAIDLGPRLVIGISSRALFDLELENRIFELDGVEAYRDFQREHEHVVLGPGAAFPIVRALLKLNRLSANEQPLVEVVVMSRNSPDLGLRVLHSATEHGLDITRAAFSSGRSLSPYLSAFSVDLFLSRSASDVQEAVDAGIAAAEIYDPPEGYQADEEEIRIAFDADAVIFSDESEQIYKTKGLDAFLEHEKTNAKKPLAAGPFAKLLKALAALQQAKAPLRIAIVTARNSPAHERVIRTLRLWGVSVNEAFFLGGVPKDQVLSAFRAHIFFDDQHNHIYTASKYVPAARVPYIGGDLLKKKPG